MRNLRADIYVKKHSRRIHTEFMYINIETDINGRIWICPNMHGCMRINAYIDSRRQICPDVYRYLQIYIDV